MLAIATALVISLALLRTQSVSLQISRNGVRRDLAFQAAQAGASAALERIQSTQWTGVGETPSRTVLSDAEGTSSYAVAFKQYAPSGVTPSPDRALSLVIESTGKWQSAANAADQVLVKVEVVARLEPRVPGRTVYSGDSAVASDLTANPGSYDQIQNYAIYAKLGTTSLVIDPQSSIEGSLWLYNKIQLFEDPRWSASIRTEYLKSLKGLYVSGSTASYPHPLAGPVTFYTTPPSSSDLSNLGVSWSQTSTQLTYPSVAWDNWRTYRLYNNGFVYQAVTVTSPLSNVTLRPTASNPLGIFVCEGSLTVRDNVTIQGTLVCVGALTIDGNSVNLTSYNWRGTDGAALVSNVTRWPRLPAIVADTLLTERDIRATVEGAVVVRRGFMGGGSDFEYMNATNQTSSGTATAVRSQQPLSVVQLVRDDDGRLYLLNFGADKYKIAGLNGNGDYAIWLDSGNRGAWYPITGVDATNGRLTVFGEVELTSETNYSIRRNRKRFTEIRGPIAAETHELNRPPCWDTPGSTNWSSLHNQWASTNALLQTLGWQQIPFVTWLGIPFNFTGWSYPINTYGLPVEPTFHVARTDNVSYRWVPPVFTAYDGSGSNAPYAGYRWKVLSWREAR